MFFLTPWCMCSEELLAHSRQSLTGECVLKELRFSPHYKVCVILQRFNFLLSGFKRKRSAVLYTSFGLRMS